MTTMRACVFKGGRHRPENATMGETEEGVRLRVTRGYCQTCLRPKAFHELFRQKPKRTGIIREVTG